GPRPADKVIDHALDMRMKMARVALPHVGALPIVVGEDLAATCGAAGAMRLVPDILVVVEIPGALVQRDFLAGRDVAARDQRDFVGEPAVRVAGMVEVLVD